MDQSNVPEIEITYKCKIAKKDRVKASTAEATVKLLRQLWNADSSYCESFYLLLCNSNCEVIGWKRISTGGVNGCIVDLKIVLGVAVTGLAHSIIVAHNHPSGSLTNREVKKCLQVYGYPFE